MPEKTCTKCGATKPIDQFYRKQRNKDGYASSCKTCQNQAVKNWESMNPKSLRERTYRWRAKNPEKAAAIARRSQFKILYGITVEQHAARLERQGGRCAICRSENPRTRWGSFCIDHDHACCPQSGKSCGKCLRGLLCGNCNTLLGMADDRVEVLKAAIAYLEADDHGF